MKPQNLMLLVLLGLALPAAAAQPVPPDAFGNVIPDFSLAGYRNGGVPLPVAPEIETLQPAANGDDSLRIQNALDRVAKLPPRPADGVRGGVVLEKGLFRCGSTLRVRPGVTLRGKGQDADGTTILATMIPREGAAPALIRVDQPRSLYLAQLETRLGPDAVRTVTTVEQRDGTIREALRRRFNSKSGSTRAE